MIESILKDFQEQGYKLTIIEMKRQYNINESTARTIARRATKLSIPSWGIYVRWQMEKLKSKLEEEYNLAAEKRIGENNGV